jgi:hypothetical protein
MAYVTPSATIVVVVSLSPALEADCPAWLRNETTLGTQGSYVVAPGPVDGVAG